MLENTKKPSKSKKIRTLLVLVVVLALVGFGGWSFYNYKQSQKEVLRLSTVEGQQEISEQKLEDLLARVKSHMILPEGEEPVVATISDVESLKKDNPFFEEAQDGDKVIVYVEARKAIVYSPERDLIVTVGPVVTEDNQEKVKQQSQAPKEKIEEEEREEEKTKETEETKEIEEVEEVEE